MATNSNKRQQKATKGNTPEPFSARLSGFANAANFFWLK
jgi:hypothetical protein